MTIIQHLHHAEQMEALRRDFLKEWNELTLPVLKEMNYDEKDFPSIMQGCWEGFVADNELDRMLATAPRHIRENL